MRSCGVALTKPAHDLRVPESPHRLATDLDELLATLAEAPDLASSAEFLLSRLGELLGSSRGYVRLLDPSLESLNVVAMVGFDAGTIPSLSVSDMSHPVVVAALSLHPIVADGHAVDDARIPFRRWIALPLPRGDDRTGPALLPTARAADIVSAWRLNVGPRPTR